MKGSITVRDVAKALGVSASTVSRALSSSELVAPRTRQQIVDKARELGYSPNNAARGLVTGRKGTLGLVVPDLENPYFASVTKGVQARALTAGYSVFVADSDEDSRVELELVRKLKPQVDGLILCSSRLSDQDLASLVHNTSVLLINRRMDGLPNITLNDGEMVRQALEHLHALGHRHVGYAGGPTGSWSDRQRRLGIEQAVPGLDGLEVLSLGSFAPVFGGGQSAADLAVAAGVTAVLAYNDLVALGIVARLNARGISVPDEMSVVGIDDINAATLVSPALTTVRAPLRKLGSTAVDLLVDSFASASVPRPAETLPIELVVRQSTSVPPSSTQERPSGNVAGRNERKSHASI
ncbi:LacI family DNA-binding transcriptional regulator [Arthrobacter sp. UYEF20]|uniref:LacI family DNA-binding transcriptional regulator n=1 Tax=Arthrobacter sp. UYEF20 TaxID=1756363 RepID=UPI003395C2BB